MRCVRYLMFQSCLNKKTFTSIALWNSAETFMWLRSLDCFMQKGQDESVDSAEMISVPFGLRHKQFSRCPGVLFWYSDHSNSILIQRHIGPSVFSLCLMIPGVPTTERFSRTVCEGKLVVHNHLTSHYFFEVPGSLGWRAAFTLGISEIIEIYWDRCVTSSFDCELRLRRGSYSKLGASRCQMVISCFTWV